MLLRMTDRRKAILDFLWDYVKLNGYSPTIREIGKAVGITSTSVVAYHIKVLEAAGAVSRNGEIRATTPLLGSNDVLFVRAMPPVLPTRRKHRLADLRPVLGCVYCGREDGVLHADHFWPIALGGKDDASNLVPACSDCNLTKNARDPVSWCLDRHGPEALTRAIRFMHALWT